MIFLQVHVYTTVQILQCMMMWGSKERISLPLHCLLGPPLSSSLSPPILPHLCPPPLSLSCLMGTSNDKVIAYATWEYNYLNQCLTPTSNSWHFWSKNTVLLNTNIIQNKQPTTCASATCNRPYSHLAILPASTARARAVTVATRARWKRPLDAHWNGGSPMV